MKREEVGPLLAGEVSKGNGADRSPALTGNDPDVILTCTLTIKWLHLI